MSDHSEIIERFQEHVRAGQDNYDEALLDLEYRAGRQWTAAEIAEREKFRRPMITVNRMGQFVRQITGPLRQSKPSIQPVPVDAGPDVELTKIMAGLIRQIEYQSGADSVYGWGADCAVTCGIGHWQIITKFCDDSFDQDVLIKRIVDPLAVVWDSGAVELDRSDATECFVSEWLTEDAYAKEFKGKSLPSDFPAAGLSDAHRVWFSDKRVRVASRWYREPVKHRLGMTQDGRIFDITGWPRETIAAAGVVRERVADSYEIMHQRMSGDDFLGDPEKWAGRHIPVVPIIGEEVPIAGLVVRHGVIRYARDPQKLYNYWRSASAELIGSAPKAPFIGTQKMFSGLEHIWGRANIENMPFLAFNPDPSMPGAKPQRQEPPAPPAALWQEAKIAQDDMKGVTGIYDAALGAQSNETSGVAIEARKTQSTDGTYIYFDNFNHAIRRTGQILIDIIPRVYDSQRTVRIIGEDGEQEFREINTTVQTPDGPTLVHDLTASKFDVRVKTGPNYANAREETGKLFAQILAANPAAFGVIGDLYVENSGIPGADKIAERLRKAMPPQLTGDGQEQPQPQDPIAEAMQRAGMAGAEADVRLKQAKADSAVMDNQAKAEALGL